ncbi:hypothetical protein PRZ48_012019 [Zasmidium cellare]|uniref:Alpha-L-arabinofuranosidase 1 catalytic domain-containing protein n=1 Tax=Zasmidium cellare TaxID=395010 RepID=A0ABR0E804_ZASCE|nr:hypothetical protein PRZ48_012019 [Zasmidium cellare]
MAGVWSGLYLNGATVAQSELSPYVQLVLDEMELLTHSIEIGNEDPLDNGYNSCVSYRFYAFYQALSRKYPDVHYISTVEWTPPNGMSDGTHPYGNERSRVQYLRAAHHDMDLLSCQM